MVVFFVQLHFTTRVRYGFLSVQLNYTIRQMYLLVLSENLKTSLCSRTTVFPGFARTFSFGARLTPLNLASLEKRKKQRFNGFCHSPFQLFHVKQFLEKRKQNVSRETFLGWIKGGRKRETAPAAKAVPVRGKFLPSLRGERGSFNPSISAALI